MNAASVSLNDRREGAGFKTDSDISGKSRLDLIGRDLQNAGDWLPSDTQLGTGGDLLGASS
jgi:hypothetical protein